MEEEKEEKLAINREDAEEKGRRRRRRSASFSLSFLQTLVFLLRRVYSLLPRPLSFLSFANSVLQPSLLFSRLLAHSLDLLGARGKKKEGGGGSLFKSKAVKGHPQQRKKREREKILFLIKYREADRLRSLVVFFSFLLSLQ